MSKKQELIDKLREVRSTLLSTTLGLTEEQLTGELVTEKWAIKDILGHITSWEEEFSSVVNRFLAEEKPEYGYLIREDNNWSEWNLAQWEKKRGLSYKRTLVDFLEVHERLVRLIESLEEKDLQLKKMGSWGSESSIEQIILAQIDHELEHANQILEWREANHK